jgi:TatD DNase family protein
VEKVFHSVEKNFHGVEKTAEIFHGLEKCFHSVEKSEKSFPCRGSSGFSAPPGILHCFTGGAGFAERLVELGFMISFSGIATFNNAGPLREVARGIPEGQLLIETDCPYLTPKPFRGKVNEPAYVARVAEVLAEVRGTSAEALARTTYENAARTFQLEGQK